MKRALLLATAGAAGAAAALVASPATYDRLRRLARPTAGDDRLLEIQDFPPPPRPAEEPDDARESLRARLAAELAPPPATPEDDDARDAGTAASGAAADELRAAVEATRARLREKAAGAAGAGDTLAARRP